MGGRFRSMVRVLAVRHLPGFGRHQNTITYKKLLVTVLLASIVSLILGSESYSQTPYNTLKGIKEVEVLIEGLGGAEKKCGLSKSGLRSAVLFPIATSQLKVVDQASIKVYENATAVHHGSIDLCEAKYQVQLYTKQQTLINATNIYRRVELNLWDRGGVISGPKGTFEKLLRDTIEDLAKELVVDWSLDQE